MNHPWRYFGLVFTAHRCDYTAPRLAGCGIWDACWIKHEKLVGIARMAAESDVLEAKKRVEYLEIDTRQFVGRCSGTRMPFVWTVNPHRGCEFTIPDPAASGPAIKGGRSRVGSRVGSG